MTDAGKAANARVNATKVFISYAREDEPFTRQLIMALEDRGFGPLVDVRTIAPGENWKLRLTNLMDQSTTVVVVLTDSYLESDACSWEIAEAHARKKRMLCVRPTRVTRGDKIPDLLNDDQHVFFYSDPEIPDSGFYDGVRKLEIGLRQNLNWLTLQRRYEVLADEWKSGKAESSLLIGSSLTEGRAWLRNPPEKMEVPAKVAEFIAASEKAELKRLQKAKRDRLISIGLTAAGVLLLGTALYLGFATLQKQAALENADARTAALNSDITQIDESYRLWSQGQTLLNNNIRNASKTSALAPEAPASQPAPDGGEVAAQYELENIAYPGVTQLIGAVRALDALSDDGKSRFAVMRQNIERDLALGYYHGKDAKALELLDRILAAPVDLDDSTVLMQRRDDFVSLAIYSCLSDDRRGNPAAALATAPEGIRDLVFWSEISPRLERDNACPEARTALCSAARGCPDTRGPLPSSPSSEQEPDKPAPVADQETDATLFAIREVYLHIPSEGDRAQAEIMRDALRKAGLRVLGIELVPAKPGANRSVRYFYTPQKDAAGELIKKLGVVANDSKVPQWADGYRLVSLVGRYEGLPPNRVEIWF